MILIGSHRKAVLDERGSQRHTLYRILKRRQALASGIGVIVGAIIMVIGYTLGRAYIYSTLEYSLIKLPFEIVQAGFGAVFAMVVCYPLRLRKLYFMVVHE